jgi:outer membrane PBP1 activator LpoA protein
MRRLLPALLATVVLAGALCGCQTDGSDDMMQRMQQNQRAASMRAA